MDRKRENFQIQEKAMVMIVYEKWKDICIISVSLWGDKCGSWKLWGKSCSFRAPKVRNM